MELGVWVGVWWAGSAVMVWLGGGGGSRGHALHYRVGGKQVVAPTHLVPGAEEHT